MAPQSLDFRRVRRRIRRTLNYGTHSTKSLSLPLSQFVVEYFSRKSPYDYMLPETSTSVSHRGFADPCTLVVAMVYLDRLRIRDKDFFESSNPLELYLPALILASKYLHDSDVDERAANEDWASVGEMDPEQINKLEWDFVNRLNWDCWVKPEDFEKYLSGMERFAAKDFMEQNGFGSYNELRLISEAINSSSYWKSLQCLLSVCGLSSVIYAFTLLSVLAAPVIFESLASSARLSLSTYSPLSPTSPCNHSLPSGSVPAFEEGNDMDGGSTMDMHFNEMSDLWATSLLMDKDETDSIVDNNGHGQSCGEMCVTVPSLNLFIDIIDPLESIFSQCTHKIDHRRQYDYDILENGPSECALPSNPFFNSTPFFAWDYRFQTVY